MYPSKIYIGKSALRWHEHLSMISNVLNHGILTILTVQMFMWFFSFQIFVIILHISLPMAMPD